jgi:cell division protein FtsI (penicillin-binding protein 3)
VLKKSSNIGSAKIALMLGDERLARYMRGFGLGGQLGIDLPGEEQGILHPTSKWSAISSSRLAIGQGVAVTALQMLGVMCTIANDGKLMQPYVVSRVVDKEGSVLYGGRPRVLGQPITPATAKTMRRLLARITEDGGTGRRARVPGYTVAGKTGTAQKPVNGGYSQTDYMASFVGFLPAENPQIGIIVVADAPQPLHTGGAVAAPAFSEIAAHAMRYLGILPLEEDYFVASH